jgi:hypothetical protein
MTVEFWEVKKLRPKGEESRKGSLLYQGGIFVLVHCTVVLKSGTAASEACSVKYQLSTCSVTEQSHGKLPIFAGRRTVSMHTGIFPSLRCSPIVEVIL